MVKKFSWMKTVGSVVAKGCFFYCVSIHFAMASKDFSKLLEFPRVKGEVIVKIKPNKNIEKMVNSNFFKSNVIKAIQVFPTNKSYVKVVLRDDKIISKFLKSITDNKDIEYAEPNYLYRISAPQQPLEVYPNDTDFSKLWGLKNTGQIDSAGQTGISGSDIAATRAWLQAKGSKDIKVAVIDTGVDYNHADLAANIFKNPGESGNNKEANGIDDDNNGFVDDVYGWNFSGGNNNSMDDHGHGTHCSGTIGALADNGSGVSGVAWNVSILPIKFLSANGSGSLEHALQGIQYATKMGVQIMSNSWGGGPFSQAMFDAIAEAREMGILFIAAAGNDAENSDIVPHYPAGYQIANVISVAATDNRDQLASFSTWGKQSVHIAAPGVKILSTLPKNAYGIYSGTSMATPHVAGAAVVLWSYFPGLNFLEVKEKLMQTRDPKIQLARKVASSGRLNLFNSLNGILVPSDEPQESEWIDGSSISIVESAHPYVDNTVQEWTIDGPSNAKYMRVRFSSYDLEPRFDVVRIMGSDGVEADAISGVSSDPYYSWYVEGGKIKIKFTSDTSVTAWGFAVDSYQYIPK